MDVEVCQADHAKDGSPQSAPTLDTISPETTKLLSETGVCYRGTESGTMRELKLIGFSVGWFGIPGGPESRSTKTHIVIHGKPVCGSVLSDEMEFQWCADSIYIDYVECHKCLNSKFVKEYEEIYGNLELLVNGFVKKRR